MKGEARAPGAATVINAIATLRGSAFAVDLHTRAKVELDDGPGVQGSIEDRDGDTALIERCVELTLERFNLDHGGRVETSSEVPIASGLKSSSAAANASVLATLDALGMTLEPIEAALIGVEAARETGVTVTGAFDDAAASMLGGVVVTDNEKDELVKREEAGWSVAVYVPDESAESGDADVERCRLVAPVVERAYDLALQGEYADALTINGLAYCAALGYDPAPAVTGLAAAEGAGLSGTGPSFAAIGTNEQVKEVLKEWGNLEGTVLELRTDNEGARI